MGSRFRLDRPTTLARKLRARPTEAELKLWRHLRDSQLHGFKFSRQMPIAGHICDFVCRSARLVVEVDGGQHAGQAEQDQRRTEKLEQAGYQVIRFWNHDVLANVAGVLAEIARASQPGAHPPAPSRMREGEHGAR